MSVRSFLAGASAATALVLLTACSSATPSAASIARRIPGCHPQALAVVPVQPRQEVRCQTAADRIWVATFSSASAEQSWLNAGGVPGIPMCIQGSRWAAAVIASTVAGADGYRDARTIIGIVGGRIAQTGNCQ